jgi:hypothetical protein
MTKEEHLQFISHGPGEALELHAEKTEALPFYWLFLVSEGSLALYRAPGMGEGDLELKRAAHRKRQKILVLDLDPNAGEGEIV